MNKRSRKLLSLHGMRRRYENIVRQCELSKGSNGDLEALYNNQRKFIEQCECFLSITSIRKTNFGAAFLSFSNNQCEYFAEQYRSRDFFDETHRDLNILNDALRLWLCENEKKLAIITSNEQLYSLLQTERTLSESQNGKLKSQLIHGINEQLSYFKVSVMVFCISASDQQLMEILCRSEKQPEAVDEMSELLRIHDINECKRVTPEKERMRLQSLTTDPI